MDENAQSTTTSTTSNGIQDYYNLIKAEHEANNAWSAEQAQKAMDYQMQMSNTAHQREVADLKAAGLNPVLSAGGSGASSGSGIAAQRGDENVTALYGLTKTALDATIKQASAMNNIARAYGSGSGVSSTSSRYGFDTGSDSTNAILDAAADFLYRRFGIKQDTTKELVNSGVIQSALNWLGDNIGVHSNKTYESVPLKGSKLLKGSSPVVIYHGRQVNVTGSAKGLNSSTSPISKMISSIRDFGRRVSSYRP